jgi:hypothetical protein
MRLKTYLGLLTNLLLLAPPCSALVVDRVAIVIGKTVVTESEVLDELRVTEFLNNQLLDLGPAARRAAAEHLVDQELIRQEMEVSGFAQPPATDAGALLRQFLQERFHSLPEYRAALAKYGIAEEQLKQRLLWQRTAIRFTDLRFRPSQTEGDAQTANRADEAANTAAIDQQMDAWLKQARANTKIVFKPEAFR